MALNIFSPLRDLQGNQLRGASWYRNAVSLITDRVSAGKLMREGKVLGMPSAGRMSMFYYDPKTKAKMPYYDIFPLVLPIDAFRGGFIGLNMHYLPYPIRYRLIDRLQAYASNDKFDRSTRIDVSYSDLKGQNIIKPAIKKYLYRQCRSGFLRIDADEMAIAAYLPVADFKGASLSKVFSDSRRAI